MLELLIAAGIILIIVCLVIRDQTEDRLTRIRSGVVGLRAAEQRITQKHKEMETLAEHANEAFARANQRQKACEQGNRVLIGLLEELHPLITKMPLEQVDD